MPLRYDTFLGGAAGGTAGEEEGALIALDFLAGTYSVNGEAKAAADVIDHPEWVSASGLDLLWANEPSQGEGLAYLIGDAMTQLQAMIDSCTIVIEYQELFANSDTYLFGGTDAELPSVISHVVSMVRDADGSFRSIYAYDETTPGPTTRDVRDLSPAVGVGNHKIALTRTAAKLVMSKDGEDITSEVGAQNALTLNYFAFGSLPGDWLYNQLHIRSFEVYEAQDDAALPVLSAL